MKKFREPEYEVQGDTVVFTPKVYKAPISAHWILKVFEDTHAAVMRNGGYYIALRGDAPNKQLSIKLRGHASDLSYTLPQATDTNQYLVFRGPDNTLHRYKIHALICNTAGKIYNVRTIYPEPGVRATNA